MAALGIEVGSVDNRSFSSSTGLGKKIKDWAVKTPSNHGPGWYLWDDQSALGTNPYIVLCNQASPTPNSKAVFVQVMVDSVSERINFTTYLYWNNSTHAGLVSWQSLALTTQTGTFAYYLRGGDDILMIITRIGSSVSHARVGKWTGIWDGVWKLTEPESTSGVLANPAFYETDPGGYLSGYHLITGYVANLDANGKLYFNIVLVSGTTYRIDIFKDSARTQQVGFTSNFTNTATGAKAITASNSSGLGGTVNVDITVTAVTNIDCRFLRLDLGSGQGTNFVIGRYYFLIDLTTGTALVSFLKVTGKSGDQLIVDFVGARAFPAGAYISPYPLRWVCAGSTASGSFNAVSTLPYVSIQGTEAPGANSGGHNAVSDYMQQVMLRCNPDRMGNFPTMNPWWGESVSSQFYGTENEILYGAIAGLNILLDRRTIGGIPYICFSIPGAAVLVRDQESLT